MRKLSLRLLMGVSLGNAQAKLETDPSRSRSLGCHRNCLNPERKKSQGQTGHSESERTERRSFWAARGRKERTTGSQCGDQARTECGVDRGGHRHLLRAHLVSPTSCPGRLSTWGGWIEQHWGCQGWTEETNQPEKDLEHGSHLKTAPLPGANPSLFSASF